MSDWYINQYPKPSWPPKQKAEAEAYLKDRVARKLAALDYYRRMKFLTYMIILLKDKKL